MEANEAVTLDGWLIAMLMTVIDSYSKYESNVVDVLISASTVSLRLC